MYLKKLNSILDYIRSIFSFEKKERESKYEVISHEENYNNTGEVYLKVRIKGLNKVFFKPLKDLYTKKWIEDFSREDAAFIGVLFLAEQRKDYELIKLFPTKKRYITKNVIFIGMLFISFLILSNLTAFKIIQLHFLTNTPFSFDIHFPAALIFFPITYFFDDTLTEVYGFKVSRFIIWSGLVCNIVITLGIYATISINPSSFWHYQSEYSMVFGSSLRVFYASIISYFFGEFCNSIILSKVKVLTSGKWLWLRVVTSTSIAVAIDSFIFCNLAFSNFLPPNIIWKMILTQYLFKVGYELLALPLTYFITGYLKAKDKVDYYDYTTSFNPFSLKIDEDE